MKKFGKSEIFAWMPAIGFDKDKPDKGVSELLERMQFVPDAVSVFMFHSDIVHQYKGLDSKEVFPPDFCGYYANPYNEERRRQDWTNFDLKVLVDELNKVGSQPYLGIMGVDLADNFHKEWLTEHSEIKNYVIDKGTAGILVLKRFKDGSYYEDFFAEQASKILVDYGFAGLHVTDVFCPQSGSLYKSDYSIDMFSQFIDHTGIKASDDLMVDADDNETMKKRRDWVWENYRMEWIEFYSWRWERFWKKVCDKLHSVGKKVIVLGMYVSDPFETLYHSGIDLKKLVNAGVDYLMPNTVPNGCSLFKIRPYRYYQYMAMIPLTDAFVNGGKSISLLGVKDASEEWDLLHHTPTLLERDIYYMPSFFRKTKSGMKRCMDGMFICLGDGIYKDEWKWLSERFEIGFGDTPKSIKLPTLIWSDTAFYNIIPEYAKTRRWTLHKFMYELAKIGGYTGAVARIEDIDSIDGPLFIPNFDMLSEDEQKKVKEYSRGGVICTASAENGFDISKSGFKPDVYFEDTKTPYKNCAFAYGFDNLNKEEILAYLDEIDDSPVLDDPFHAQECISMLNNEFPFQKVSKGFLKACSKLLMLPAQDLFETTHPIIPMEMNDGRIRLYAFNDDRLNYAHCIVTAKKTIEKVENVSKYPLLPVKFSETGRFSPTTQDYPGNIRTFRLLLPPGGASIVDVYLKD